MGWFATLFGTAASAGTAVDLAADSVRGVGRWIDEQKFTEQEKAEQYLKAADMYIEMLKTIQSESSIRSVTRRLMAWAVIGTFLFLILYGTVWFRYDPDYAEFILTVATKSMLGELTLGVSVFYFGVHLLRAFNK